MTENKIKYNSYENSFYINDDEGISQIIAPELIIEIINDYEKEIVKLKQKNKELKERNNRQAKQLDNIYHLIEQRDWRALSDIMDDFKKAEEQLQSEWKCYE